MTSSTEPSTENSQHPVETYPNDPSWSQRLLLRGLRSYRGVSGSTMARCRYLPTCSEFATTAISRHGAGKGSWLAVKRICRCHPFGSHGFDPVPPKQTTSDRPVPREISPAPMEHG